MELCNVSNYLLFDLNFITCITNKKDIYGNII